MSEHTFVPKGHGFTQVLHWDGPGWYGSLGGSQNITHAWKYVGAWDENGFSIDPDTEIPERIWDARQGLGTPFYLASVEDFAGEDFVEVN